MDRTLGATFHSRQPLSEVVVTAAPVVAGWFRQVTPFPFQGALTCGTAGRSNCNSAPRLFFDFDITLD
jgi:hypothetical protein